MPALDMTILYVADVTASARFYARLLGAEPVEQVAGFAMFRAGGGLGLWQHGAVLPSAGGAPGCNELCFMTDDVEALHAEWQAQGITIIDPPTVREFGTSVTGVDPDGHRLRGLVRAG